MPDLTAETFRAQLHAMANPAQATILQRFFKTGPGEYGEGDVFIGVMVPQTRRLVRAFRGMPPANALPLVRSNIHEERLAGLLLWVDAFARGTERERASIVRTYLRNTRYINNWDLVDLSAPQIIGGHLTATNDLALLDKLAASKLLWDRRIAVLATLAFIRSGSFAPTLRICTTLLTDKHDLMHKACGWMLREVGKRDRATLCQFLNEHAASMPRTMLRYALEHFAPAERARYMAKKPL